MVRLGRGARGQGGGPCPNLHGDLGSQRADRAELLWVPSAHFSLVGPSDLDSPRSFGHVRLRLSRWCAPTAIWQGTPARSPSKRANLFAKAAPTHRQLVHLRPQCSFRRVAIERRFGCGQAHTGLASTHGILGCHGCVNLCSHQQRIASAQVSRSIFLGWRQLKHGACSSSFHLEGTFYCAIT